ncbi:HNH endonuclease [Streptomyces fungicidicus]|uniref:HNH endonuclease n=1 Tax=Streptomyces fungicidicus TaxID=68203 RepID=UPI00331FAB89
MFYEEAAYNRASELLRASEDSGQRGRFEMRLRLALHLSPKTAISYDRRNATPRWRLIYAHLVDGFAYPAESSEVLARAIARTLDNWDEKREGVTAHKNFLIQRDGNRCQNCLAVLGSTDNVTVVTKDPFKPYYLAPEELLRAEVDHMEAVSTFGTNDRSNLQLLCRLCNSGKGDGLGLSVRQEAQFAGFEIGSSPISYRSALVYWVIERDGRKCPLCGLTDRELTIRPVIDNGSLVRSNMRSACVVCAGPTASAAVTV